MALITILSKNNNPIYLLNENIYYNTEHKIMQHISGLLPCYKSNLNGKDELMYITGSMALLNTMLPSLDAKSFTTIILRMCETIRLVISNSFLNLAHLDIERTFIQDTMPYLTYLPVVSSPGECTEDTIISYFMESLAKIKNPSDIIDIIQTYNVEDFFRQQLKIKDREYSGPTNKTLRLNVTRPN